jgi:hypothetical protein
MANKKPIVLYGGIPGELASGDIIPNSLIDATPRVITGVAGDNFSVALRLNSSGEIVMGLPSKGNKLIFIATPPGWQRGIVATGSGSTGYTNGKGPYWAANIAATNDAVYLGDVYFTVGDVQTVDWVVAAPTAPTSGENFTASVGFMIQQTSGNTGTGNYAAYWQINNSGVNVICKNGSGVSHTVPITLTGFDFTVPGVFRVILKATTVEFWWNGTLQYTETSSTYIITDTAQKLCAAINVVKNAGSATRVLAVYSHNWS